MKILAGRPKVLEDLRTVLAEQRARLDVDYIRSIVGILEQALGQSDLALARNSPWPTHTDFRS